MTFKSTFIYKKILKIVKLVVKKRKLLIFDKDLGTLLVHNNVLIIPLLMESN